MEVWVGLLVFEEEKSACTLHAKAELRTEELLSRAVISPLLWARPASVGGRGVCAWVRQEGRSAPERSTFLTSALKKP